MSFSSTLLHARKSRANSEISELLTARRMDITVWMSSPNDEVPAVAEAGSDTGGSRRIVSPDGPGAALGGSVGFGLPHGNIHNYINHGQYINNSDPITRLRARSGSRLRGAILMRQMF
ncbi:hypothetical protein EVAR_13282_1 [Eumeta japonica]|uniref:Uncharacterized protein n=1 Tax=Eumeta variegata TaxID=151549 RepID=A0A4C1YRK3_EUMVA|nr:hypothetical protein EVAR_13282_1 [Eumeta japonica]